MRQTGDWKENADLTPAKFEAILLEAINNLDIEQARKEIEPFVKHPENLSEEEA